jgi:hypothetical protein
MRLSLPLQRLVPLILLAALAAAFLAVVVGQLGSGGGSPDVNQVLDRAFSNSSLKSGRFNASLGVSIQGASSPQLATPVEISMNGAFERAAPDRLQKFDLDMSFSGPGSPIQLGVVSTGKKAFVKLSNRAYELPRRELERVFSGSTADARAQGQTALALAGIDPHSWLLNPTNQGSASVDGIETNHVSAALDTGRLLDDAYELASRADQGQVSRQQLDQLKGFFKDARLDLYAAKSDGGLRKITAQVKLQAPQGSGNLNFAFEMTDVNKPQKIVAPQNALPFSDLRGDFVSGLLSGLGNFGAVGGSSAGGSSVTGGGTAAGATGTTSGTNSLPGAAQTYLKCIQKATRDADIQKCAPLLQ